MSIVISRYKKKLGTLSDFRLNEVKGVALLRNFDRKVVFVNKINRDYAL